MKLNIIPVLFIGMLLLVAGCSTAVEPQSQGQVEVPSTSVSATEDEVPEISEQVEQEIQRTGDEVENQEQVTSQQAEGQLRSFSESTTYTSPGGSVSLQVQLEVEGEIVTSVEVSSSSAGSISSGYIEGFNNDIKELVVGKSINELNLPNRIGSSSLTIDGFNDALDNVKNQLA